MERRVVPRCVRRKSQILRHLGRITRPSRPVGRPGLPGECGLMGVSHRGLSKPQTIFRFLNRPRILELFCPTSLREHFPTTICLLSILIFIHLDVRPYAIEDLESQHIGRKYFLVPRVAGLMEDGTTSLIATYYFYLIRKAVSSP